MSLNIAFFGYTHQAALCLEELVRKGYEVCSVVTHSSRLGDEEMLEFAGSMGMHPFIVDSKAELGNLTNTLSSLEPDILVCVSFKFILPETLIKIPRLGAINVHGSLLPKYRGRAPAAWAIVDGEKTTGVSVHFMDEGCDTGNIIVQQEIPIAEDYTIADVFRIEDEIYPPLLVRAIELIRQGFKGIPQDRSKATYGGKRKPEDGLILWEKGAIEIYNLIRAVTHPYPGAFTFWRGNKLIIWGATLAKETTKVGIPGEVIAKDTSGVLIQCGDNRQILASYVQILDGDEIEASKCPVEIGEVLGQ